MNFLSIQGSYSSVFIALYINKKLVAEHCLESLKASSHLVPFLKQLFESNNITFKDLDFIALDKGPGAFTALRVMITIINGISYSTGIPLVPVDGLEAMYQQACDDYAGQYDIICCLLNAYSRDVYFLIQNSVIAQRGCANIDNVSTILCNFSAQKKVLFIGNGVDLHEKKLRKDINSAQGKFIYGADNISVSSVSYITKIAIMKWQDKTELQYKVIPYYMKEQAFATSS